ncbi:hypothetical protein DL96DRAFT_1809905 [Flagelloscypha sp. PMI_526]|nr:hypothetical protein DL96DRAFT_1809905 [Flagelloscypha sp. PMI_526]
MFKHLSQWLAPAICSLILFIHAPPGKLASRQESRTLSTSERQAQDENARLHKRIVELEEALAFVYSQISKEVHPLLTVPLSKKPEDNPDDHANQVLATLADGDAREVNYSEPTIEDETLYEAASPIIDPPSPQSLSPQADLDSTLERLTTQIPLGSPFNLESFVPSILKDLPERMRAWSLCEIFYANYTVYSIPVQQEELEQVYLSPIYKYLEDSRTNQDIPLPSTTFRPHRCAVIFFIFAIAAWLDVTEQQYWIEADRYFQVGLSCLSKQSILNSPEVASVQALFLLACFNEVRGVASVTTMSPSWTILSLAGKIAQCLGLHRDNPHQSLDHIMIQRRRWLYWELVSLETFHSLRTRLPLSSRQVYVDAKFPDNTGQMDADGHPLPGFFRWKHVAARDCYSEVVEILLAATPAQYEVIIELDRKVRAKEIPAHLNRILIDTEEHKLTPPEFMQTWILALGRSMLLLAIHRTHLTKAFQDPSGNPLKSPYAPSFVASYRAASWIVKSFLPTQRRFPDLLPRLWHPWTNVMSAAMVLGSIVINAPSSFAEKGPLEELRIASSMFNEAAARTISPRTKNGAKIIQSILTRAEEACARVLVGGSHAVQLRISIPPTNFGDDELAIFGGHTRLLPTQSHQSLLQSQHWPFPFTSNSAGSCLGSLEDIHPSLIKFLATAPITPVASSFKFEDFKKTLFEPPLELQFYNHDFMLPRLDSRVDSSLRALSNKYGTRNVDDPLACGSQISDTFENYLTVPVSRIAPVDDGPKTSPTGHGKLHERTITPPLAIWTSTKSN